MADSLQTDEMLTQHGRPRSATISRQVVQHPMVWRSLVGCSIILGLAFAATHGGAQQMPTEGKPSNHRDPALTLIRENIYILRHARGDRDSEWAKAMRTLIRIGAPAVPELVRELDRPNRSHAIRLMAFTLRAIDDASCVPALIRAIPESNSPIPVGGTRRLDDLELAQFLQKYDLDPKDGGGDSFELMSADGELIAALESLTRHSSPKLSRADDRRRLRTANRQDASSEARQLYRDLQSEWETWWNRHHDEVLSTEVDSESHLTNVDGDSQDPIDEAGERRFGRLFPTGAEISLGPVHEVRLNADSSYSGQRCIDFDRHLLLELREGIAELPRTMSPGDTDRVTNQWCRENRIDAIAAGWKLSSRQVHIWQIENACWDSIERQIQSGTRLTLWVERSSFQPVRIDESADELSPSETTTYLFTTIDGGQGILQLPARRLEEPMFFRYRMWNQSHSTDNAETPSHVLRSQPKRDGEWTPEVQVTLHNAIKDPRACFRLSDGELIGIPKNIAAVELRSSASWDWMEEAQVDFRTREVSFQPFSDNATVKPATVSVLCLVGRRMVAVPISSEAYDQLTVTQVEELLDRWPEYDRELIQFDGSPGNNMSGFHENRPCIHAFRNHDGRHGMVKYFCPHNETASINVQLKWEVTAPK
ncbi:MAG: hypothetical protein U0996_09485 [Planctomycetaceae bacterium]